MYDSIYITLGLVNWNWFGNAEESGYTWNITSSGVTGPTLVFTDELPEWLWTE